MTLDEGYAAQDAYFAKIKTQAEQVLQAHLERGLHPSQDRLREIAEHWAMMHWWTAEECASLLMGADPDMLAQIGPDFLIYLVQEAEQKRFFRLLDLVRRRFGDRVTPIEAQHWAASKGIKQEYLQQALASTGGLEPRDIRKPAQTRPKPRREDITKLDITRSKMIAGTAIKRKFDETKHDGAVGQFRTDLEDAGLPMDNGTIKDAISLAMKHSQTRISLEQFVQEERLARQPHTTKGPAKRDKIGN
jgi:hypothetical protein